jgi:hypothetical protein
VTEALTTKLGPPTSRRPPRSNRKFEETFFNERRGRSFNVHEQPGHQGGKPHVDVGRRGNYPERKFMTKEGE